MSQLDQHSWASIESTVTQYWSKLSLATCSCLHLCIHGFILGIFLVPLTLGPALFCLFSWVPDFEWEFRLLAHHLMRSLPGQPVSPTLLFLKLFFCHLLKVPCSHPLILLLLVLGQWIEMPSSPGHHVGPSSQTWSLSAYNRVGFLKSEPLRGHLWC